MGLRVEAVKYQDLCFGMAELQLTKIVISKENEKSNAYIADLWRSDQLFDPTKDAKAAIEMAIKKLAKRFATDWREQN